jgi:hypothetical protein
MSNTTFDDVMSFIDFVGEANTSTPTQVEVTNGELVEA